MLPGKPDATEHLDAVLGDLGEIVECDRTRRIGGQAGRGWIFVEGDRGVPRDGPDLLGGDEHVCAPMFDALELPDRTAELSAQRRVLGRGSHAPTGAPGRVGSEQRGGDGAHLFVRDVERGGVTHFEPGERAGRVERFDWRGAEVLRDRPAFARPAHDDIGDGATHREIAVERHGADA